MRLSFCHIVICIPSTYIYTEIHIYIYKKKNEILAMTHNMAFIQHMFLFRELLLYFPTK